MENSLNGYISFVEETIKESQKHFFKIWNNEIRQCFQLNTNFYIEKYADLFGGYWLPHKEFLKLNSSLRHFYTGCTKFEKGIYLRGYDYYQADLVLNLHNYGDEHHHLWNVFQAKWMKYQQMGSFAFINRNMSFENWIGTLGFLEYLFSDLTSIRWFVFRNERMLKDTLKDHFCTIVEDLDASADVIGQVLAYLLKFQFDAAREILNAEYSGIIRSKPIRSLLSNNFQSIEKASIRTMREGDSLVLIYASYLLKLEPFCRKKHFNHIHLMSNAFGAMNIGIILKHLMSPNCEVRHTNILYAQHRTVGDFVYDDSLINRCCFIDSVDCTVDNEAQAFFVVDDSVCFGKSYQFIKSFIDRDSVYLLPLTLNCNGMKYFKVGLTENDDLDSIIHQSIFWAGEVNKELPAFFSFWDFRQTVPEDCSIKDPNYRFGMFGSDLLLKHLWKIYLEEILGDPHHA